MGANFARSTTNSSQTESGATSNVFNSAQLMAPIYPVYQRSRNGDYLLDDNGQKQFDYGASRPSGQQTNFNSIATLYDDKYALTSYSLSARTHLDFMGIEDHWSQGLKFHSTSAPTTTTRSRWSTTTPTLATPSRSTVVSRRRTPHRSDIPSISCSATTAPSAPQHRPARRARVLFLYRLLPLGAQDGTSRCWNLWLDAAAIIVGTGSSTDEDRIESFLSRVGYSYNDKYYLSGSWRTDGSSRFAPDTRWGNFWSVGASWRISQEQFMQNISWLDNLTLKFSYGVQGGNNSVGSYYAYQALYDTSYTNATISGVVINDVANEDLTWESNHNLNAGIEARLLNRIDLSFRVLQPQDH